MVEKGRIIGPNTANALQKIMDERKHPELGYRACMGVLRLGKRYSNERLEAACRRSIAMDVCSYRSIKSILEKSLDREALTPPETPAVHAEIHPNVRGSNYYKREEVA
jgi:transposase